jgi:glycosyltransferase involved in cell wall biosynthesis
LVLKPEIIHCHQHKLIRFLPFWRKKTVMTVHDVGIPTINLKKYKKIFAISAAVQQDLLKRGQIHSCIVRNGIVVEDIRCKRAYLFNYDKSYKIVQISRLYHEKKGQHIAIQALGKLHEAGYSNLNLYFIGNGPSLEYLKKLAKELHLEQNIFFLGIRERSWIYKNLFSFDLLVQPSLYEGFGLTVIEGIAAGLPVIASKSGGPEEILADIPSGFLFNAMDQWDLVAAIKNVIDLTVQNQIEQRCVISREIVCQSFSISQTATDYLLAYSDIQRRKGLSRTVV